ncbi:MAG: hypothetical protein ABSG14_08555 [Verrucomicrobiia bacterium]|jgi:hypothetical protein
MNWQGEYDKPVLIARNEVVTLRQALRSPAVLQNDQMFRASRANELIGKSGAAILAEAINFSGESPDRLRKLVVARLQSQPDRRFRFVDGREFTAQQAAAEVQRESTEGQYFTKLEKHTLDLIQEALRKGQIP